MHNDEQPPADSKSRTRLLVAGVAVLLVVAVLAGAWLLRARTPPGPPASQPAARPAAPPPVAEAPAEPAVSPAPPPPAPRIVRKAKPAPVQPAPTSAAVLKVDSDVPGASVFVDRTYVGTTPLTTGDLTPGSHVVQVAAEGYESQSHALDLVAGDNDVTVRFKIVRLHETASVIHKHALGSCEGRLVADVRGLRYETTNKDHAFTIPFSELRSFEVDYLKKNLRVTRKDGRTFNFTDRNPNADALFVFHKNVEAARAKLAAGFTPDK